MIGKWLRGRFGIGSAPRELFVHEDDWGQVELLPAAAADWCQQEMARIAGFATAHAAPGGGWTDLYLRTEPPAALDALGIGWMAARQTMAARLPAFDAVVSGSFSSPQATARVCGFGPASNAAAVLVPDSDGECLAAVTLVLDGSDHDNAAVIDAVHALPSPQPLMVADWARGTCLVLPAATC